MCTTGMVRFYVLRKHDRVIRTHDVRHLMSLPLDLIIDATTRVLSIRNRSMHYNDATTNSFLLETCHTNFDLLKNILFHTLLAVVLFGKC